MEPFGISKYTLNFPLSPNEPYSGTFNLLSETESERRNNDDSTQINELLAQLDIVNEDRQRLKKENERLKQEKNLDASKIFTLQAEIQKQLENEKCVILELELNKTRKECEEKDKLLNTMRKLLGGKQDFLSFISENQENRSKPGASPLKFQVQYNNKLPVTRKGLKANRSISPFA